MLAMAKPAASYAPVVAAASYRQEAWPLGLGILQETVGSTSGICQVRAFLGRPWERQDSGLAKSDDSQVARHTACPTFCFNCGCSRGPDYSSRRRVRRA